MPRGDATGPAGMGSMSGRAAGYCAGNNQPGFANPGTFRGPSQGRTQGRRMARGFGPGRGAGSGPGQRAGYGHAPWGVPARGPAPEQEATALRGQADYLGQRLEAIRNRLAELENASGEE